MTKVQYFTFCVLNVTIPDLLFVVVIIYMSFISYVRSTIHVGQ